MPSDNQNESHRENPQLNQAGPAQTPNSEQSGSHQNGSAPQPPAAYPMPPEGYTPAQANDDGTPPPRDMQEPMDTAPQSLPPVEQTSVQPQEPYEQNPSPQSNAPSGFSPTSQYFANPSLNLPPEDIDQLVRARKLSLLATISAFLSFIIGGILLGIVALVAGILSYKRFTALIAKIKNNEQAVRAYKRMAIISVAVPAVCLIVNIAFFAMLYPVLMQAVQTGQYADVFGSLGSGGGTGTTTSTWG